MKNISIAGVLGLIGLTLFCGCKNPSELQNNQTPSLWAPNCDPLMIQLPDTEYGVAMNKAIRLQGRTYISGNYTLTHAPDVVERGTVLLDAETGVHISQTSDVSAQEELYAVSFTVSNQGTGIFHYVGLFSVNTENGKRMHLVSYFLGDRIREIQLSDVGRAVKVSFLKHASDQSYADVPTEKAAVNLYVEDDLTLKPYAGMHPSWDADQDGINDCEEDGTCDDSVDYTLARQMVSVGMR